ncbi:hypothetical protein IMZ08_02840 [Bacillus luteolus]|uniref:Phenylalanyl-tRNA synthetase subunit beta n=1 Tax=Litchfieldia luteola TaxID=682179 RepID=A0ABR9QEZ9_9BACI|nr:hypothetical protein [Cytobacillus luteolus]MBE4906991.1 hypothetical protein [Cytobacillus luteolus]MBP1943542.1 hypothetical protein [Cytobacillus luteolus]
MKKIGIGFLILLGLGFFAVQYVWKETSVKIMDTALAQTKTLPEMKELLNDPSIQALLKDEKLLEESNLPFTTKEEAIKVVTGAFSAREIASITTIVANGVTEEEKVELKEMVLNRLTPEELNALMILALKEQQKEQ